MTLKEYVVSHIVNLIKIKSVLTLAFTATFVILALKGDISADQFMTMFATVVAFYFGSQTKKDETETSTESETQEEMQDPTPSGIEYDAVYDPTEEEVRR